MKNLLLLFVLLSNCSFSVQASLNQSWFTINGKSYLLEIAQTRQQLLKGLMGRTLLASNQGMLFVFPESAYQGIWMKNMQIPLTVAWLNDSYQVIKVKQLLPCKQLKCPVYRPKQPVRFVVELAAHSSIRLGDQLVYQFKKEN